MQASTGAARRSHPWPRHAGATQCGELGTLFRRLILLSITEFKEQHVQYIERGESIKHLLELLAAMRIPLDDSEACES